MALATCERWAVLVGIDWYSDGNDKRNLRGCVADVEQTMTVLQSYLGIPSDHITLLTAANGSNKCTNPPAWPTKTNVVRALKEVGTRSKPGDFVYIHYSGHGDRQPTIYSELKKGPKLDEVLCTLEEDIRDIEFGNLLDELVEKALVVCVVLDCCHSGGASRFSPQTRVRCRKIAEDSASPVSEHDEGPKTRQLRNALPVESWFYRPRGYNLIAACQPHEVAVEWTADDGKTYGAMTYHLVQSLLSLQSSTEPITYGRLQEVLEAKCKSKLKQQPMHLGDRSRVIFGTTKSTIDSTNFLANIIETSEKTVTLNKGSASTIGVGDKFRIYHPSQSYLGILNPKAVAVAEVFVSSVSELRCKATLLDDGPGALQSVKAGWLAQLSSRGEATIVNFLLPEARGNSSINATVERLQQDWHSHANAYTPLIIQLNAPDPKAELTVGLDQNDLFQFRDRNGNHMPYVPAPRADGSFSTRQMTSLLQHLCFYQLAAGMNSPTASSVPRYEFEILKDEIEEGDNESLAAWRIQFKNLHKQVLYVTIFNLGPAYGIHQIFPDDNSSSAAVDPMDEIPYLVIDMKVPQLLKTASSKPGFKMRDVIKVFITTEQADFSHYRLPDLQKLDELDNLDLRTQGPRRDARVIRPQTGSWFVDEKEIITFIDLKD
jgi:Caspase domain